MKAFVLTRYGGPECAELRDVPPPGPPGPRQVAVRVHAVGLNPLDFKIRQGKLKVIRRFPLPIVMGNELAGVVEAVGAEVTRTSPGERVFARVDKDRLGAFAENVVLDESLIARVPDELSFEQAAAIPLAALTSLQALRDELHLAPGQRVFIPGGAGGVGTFAIQIAKWLGAEVATTASPRGDALVRRLGADVVVDYTREKFEDHLSNYDGAFDLLGGESLDRTFAVVKKGGTVVSIAGMPEPTTAKDLGRGVALSTLFCIVSRKTRAIAARHEVRYRYLFMRPSGAELTELADLVKAKKLTPVIDRTFSFDAIGEAMAYLEGGHAKGKVVVRIVDAAAE